MKEFVIGFGFLSGLWIAVGVNPEAEIINAFAEVIKELGSSLGFIFYLISLIVLILSLLSAYRLGGNLGLIAIGFAFAGGLLIIVLPPLGIILVIIGIVMGFGATRGS